MMFFCVWSDAPSFLVDVPDEAAAIAAATEEEGRPPAAVRPFPAFGARVHFDDEDDDDANGAELVTLEPLPHVVDLLDELEDACTPDEPSGVPMVPECMCMAEADLEDGTILRCELNAGPNHGDKHKAAEFEW